LLGHRGSLGLGDPFVRQRAAISAPVRLRTATGMAVTGELILGGD
jgi:hypothetical protein